nr:MAG TPA: hypothetical protein [Caudoviricetes sp.]
MAHKHYFNQSTIPPDFRCLRFQTDDLIIA